LGPAWTKILDERSELSDWVNVSEFLHEDQPGPPREKNESPWEWCVKNRESESKGKNTHFKSSEPSAVCLMTNSKSISLS